MEKIETPELEKITEHRDESQSIGSFLDWLKNEQEICLCVYGAYGVHTDEDEENFADDNEQLYCINKTIEQLLAEYFEIDLDKAEKERVALLEQIRRENEKDD